MGVLGLVIVILVIAWATSPDPKFNPASFEDKQLVDSVAPLKQAKTLAQFVGEDGSVRTLLVTGFRSDTVTGVDLTEFGGDGGANPFAALASVSNLPSTLEEVAEFPSSEVTFDRLLPSGSSGNRHIGSGTNFPEHAEESNSESVFGFPKFGLATPARTTVRRPEGILLDYEVEFCVRFDRDIASLEDFDVAVKGVFLCGDFTNRNAIVELADPDNLDSGSGFSDAKSGPGFFPTGPFLVIPNNLNAFVSDLRMTTTLNGEPRQDARGGEMTLNFRQLVEKSLNDMSERRFVYRDGREFLAEGKTISADMSLMSGTAEGVIFTGPTRADYIEMIATYVAAGGPLSGSSVDDIGKATFIQNELASGHFLQPDDRVRHGSSYLGNIEVLVTK
ncbi:hypothetical protein A8B75_19110 [Sphingomonadales bacterium EhC05]|nr:hypothetical protein A8B75_19110 [Sphingomonadales bacterium EhC05]